MNFEDNIFEGEFKNTPGECLLCDQEIHIFKESVFDTRFGIEGTFNIYHCRSCDQIQLSPCMTPRHIKKLYETYYNFGGDNEGLYNEVRKAFFDSPLYRLWMSLDGDICFHSRRGHGQLIDIGCNEGQGLKIYKQNGFMVEGLELNKRAVSKAKKRGFRVFNDSLESFHPDKLYDVAVLSHILEHSLNPKEMLIHVSRILNSEGQVWICCPNVKSWQRDVFGRYWINWHVPFHYTFFSVRTLKSLLNNTGFKILKIKNASPSLWVAQSIIAALFAKKGRKNCAQRSPILIGFLMLFVRFLFFPFLWLGNFLGKGDCLIVEAKKKQKI